MLPKDLGKVISDALDQEFLAEENDRAIRLLADIASFPTFSGDQATELFKRYRKGDNQAFDCIVKGNMRYVVSVARLFLSSGEPFEDLIQEGTIGLIHAIQTFRPRSKVGFIPYSIAEIYRAIEFALQNHSSLVRIPARHIYLHKLICEFCHQYEQQHGFEPPIDEVEIKEPVSRRFIKPIFHLPDRIKDTVVLTDGWDEVEDVAEQTDSELMRQSLRFELLMLLDAMPERYGDVLKSYFGMDGRPEESLQEISNRYQLSRERIRQVKKKGIDILRKVLTLQGDDNYLQCIKYMKNWPNGGNEADTWPVDDQPKNVAVNRAEEHAQIPKQTLTPPLTSTFAQPKDASLAKNSPFNSPFNILQWQQQTTRKLSSRW